METKSNTSSSSRSSDLVHDLEEWRDTVRYEQDAGGIDGEEMEEILEELCDSIFARVIRCPSLDCSDKESWVRAIDVIISEIEAETELKIDQPKILRNANLLHQVDIRVKPWLRFKGTDSALVRISDRYKFHYMQGQTDSNGQFNAEALEGENLLVVKTRYNEKFESFDVKEDESITVHPSLI